MFDIKGLIALIQNLPVDKMVALGPTLERTNALLAEQVREQSRANDLMHELLMEMQAARAAR